MQGIAINHVPGLPFKFALFDVPRYTHSLKGFKIPLLLHLHAIVFKIGLRVGDDKVHLWVEKILEHFVTYIGIFKKCLWYSDIGKL